MTNTVLTPPDGMWIADTNRHLTILARPRIAARHPFAFYRIILADGVDVGSVFVAEAADPDSWVLPGFYWLPIEGGTPDGPYDSLSQAAWNHAPDTYWREVGLD